MLTFLLRRLCLFGPTLVGVALLCFGLLHLVPGDASGQVAGEAMQAGPGLDAEAMVRRFREEHLFDEPLWRRALHFLGPFDLSPAGHPWWGGSGEHPWGGLFALDLGTEMHDPTTRVADELGRRLAVTVPLALVSMLLAYLLAIPIGIHAAVRGEGLLGRGLSVLVFGLHALPVFWAALLAQMAFGATGLDWLPVLWPAELEGAWDAVLHAALPVACYTYGSLAYLSRQMRAGLVENLRQDYVLVARAKGLSEWAAVLRHALRNSLIPLMTLLGSVLPVLVGGSVVIEYVFDIPGMGRYAWEGLVRRDANIVLGTTLVVSCMTLLGLLLSDVLYALVDPRLRHG